jgi:hypothetical protein
MEASPPVRSRKDSHGLLRNALLRRAAYVGKKRFLTVTYARLLKNRLRCRSPSVKTFLPSNRRHVIMRESGISSRLSFEVKQLPHFLHQLSQIDIVESL